jgi:uncharacterized membrane protein YgaE (UPF0421/DUF939 family)
MAWKPLSGPQWRYCAKVGFAAALAYVLTRGNENQYAVYSAVTAAIIVGASVGEDLATSGSRVKGTLAGMIAGLAVSAFFGPSAIAVGLSVTATALLALALGWGIPVARIGVTVCIITLVFHAQSALEYDFLRGANTVIGVVIGLAVSLFVWPVRARYTVRRATDEALAAAAKLLDTLGASEEELRPAQLALYDAISALVKAGRDAKVERDARLHTGEVDARAFQVLQFGLEVLAAGLAAQGHAPAAAPLQVLRERLSDLSRA